MAKKRANHKKDKKGIKRKLRDLLGISADTIQVAQFLGVALKAIFATAIIGGTVVAGKTIIEEKTDFFKKDTSVEKVVIVPTSFESVVEEELINTDVQDVQPSVTPKSVITVDKGWGHITRDSSIAAFYALIKNTGTEADRLIGAASEICSRIGLQDMTFPGHSHEGDDVPFSVFIPVGGSSELKFLGQRMLCYDISGVKLGDHVPLTLIFEKYDEVKVMMEIRKPLASWPTPGPPSQ